MKIRSQSENRGLIVFFNETKKFSWTETSGTVKNSKKKYWKDIKTK